MGILDSHMTVLVTGDFELVMRHIVVTSAPAGDREDGASANLVSTIEL